MDTEDPWDNLSYLSLIKVVRSSKIPCRDQICLVPLTHPLRRVSRMDRHLGPDSSTGVVPGGVSESVQGGGEKP